VIFDRKRTTRAVFGLCIRRCIGFNLARMETGVVAEEWLKRIPNFRLDPRQPASWSEGTARCPPHAAADRPRRIGLRRQ